MISKGAAQLEACADCHLEHVEGFLKTGMGRSLYSVSKAEVVELYAEGRARVVHPHSGAVYEASIDDEGHWWQTERSVDGVYKHAVEVKYVIGSGNSTRSYLGEIEGELIELPLTWYSERKIWDMSPGYERAKHMRFTRPIKPDCLFCHNDLTALKDGARASYRLPLAEGITCARCHGDGQAHIDARYRGEGATLKARDPWILNPADLSPERQLQLCQQCHLAGTARALLPGQRWDRFDPSVPLERYMAVFGESVEDSPTEGARGAHNEEFGIASHGERLSMSACAQGTATLTCTTCHDPHAPASESRYQEACLGCHQEGGDPIEIKHPPTRDEGHLESSESAPACGRSHQSEVKAMGLTSDQVLSCDGCHMYRGGTSDIPHVRFTDHWIRRRPNGIQQPSLPQTQPVLPPPPSRQPERSQSLLRALLPPPMDSSPKRVKALQLGLEAIAYSDLARFERAEALPLAMTKIQEALFAYREAFTEDEGVKKWPELYKSLALTATQAGDLKIAQAALFRYAQQRPHDQEMRLQEAQTLKVLGRFQEADFVLNELLKVYPDFRSAVGERADIAQITGRFDLAHAFYERADVLAPHVASTAFNRGYLFLLQGDVSKSRLWFEEGVRRDGLCREGPFYLGALALQEGKTQQAIESLSEALRRDLDFSQALSLRGEAYLSLGQVSLGLADLLGVIQRSPYDPGARRSLSQALQRAGRVEEAISVIEEGLRVMPANPQLLETLSRLKSIR